MSILLNNNQEVWHLYIIRTAKGHLYTGITKDVTRRFIQHQQNKGARYLRGKGPLQLVYQQKAGSHSDALRLECTIKRLPKSKKETLIEQFIVLDQN